MSLVLDGQITCSMCRASFDLARAKPILESHRLKTRDVFQCPGCGYYVAVARQVLHAV